MVTPSLFRDTMPNIPGIQLPVVSASRQAAWLRLQGPPPHQRLSDWESETAPGGYIASDGFYDSSDSTPVTKECRD